MRIAKPKKSISTQLFTPSQMSYQMPAEWAKHEATWLTWPTNTTTWPGKMLAQVEEIYLQMMKPLLMGENIHLLVNDEKTAKRVASLLDARKAKTSRVVFHKVATVDTWIRDYGPIFVKRDSEYRAYTKWTFNAWGGKYADLATDTGVVAKLEYLEQFNCFENPMVLEGGSIDSNGEGICLTTTQCLLHRNRNPKFTQERIENELKKYLGFKKVIWLKDGIEGDDTDGHVDDITRFVAPNTILTAVEPDVRDKNHRYLTHNLNILKKEKNLKGKKFNIVELPMPGRVEVGSGHLASGRLPASYANFYIGNAAVLLPVYSHANDIKAEKILKRLFPKKRIVPIECTPLVYGLGSIHCVTQQQPQ